VAQTPGSAEAHQRLGKVLQLQGRLNEAEACFRRALEIEPTLPLLRNNLAAALMLSGGKLDEQLALLQSAVRDDPGNGDSWTNLANVHRMSLDLPNALKAGARGVQLSPLSPLTHNNYALALREAQRWAQA